MLDRQWALQRAWDGIKAQGGLSWHSDGYPAYENAEGRRCAIGLLFEGPLPTIIQGEQCAVVGLLRFHKEIFASMDAEPEDYGFLENLQEAHDGANDVADVEVRFQELARFYHLKFTP